MSMGRDRLEDLDLFVTDGLRVEGNGSLHGQEGQDLQEMVLHDVSDYADGVEIAAAAFGAEALFERDLDALDVVSVPGSVQELVTEAQNQEVLDELLAQVVVDSEQFFLFEQGGQVLLQLVGRGQIVAEGLLHDDTVRPFSA